MIDLSDQQRQALDEVDSWLNRGDQPVFRLFGYAGTGKTTIAKYLRSETMGLDVRYCTFTGKAAQVLRDKGCDDAQTIHSMIYRSIEKSQDAKDDLEQSLAQAKAEDPVDKIAVARIEKELAKVVEGLKQPSWMLNRSAFTVEFDDVEGAYVACEPPDLICVDECSMVGRRIGQDLESFGIPILVLGDPAQLPPVGDAGYFINAEPDFLLKEIHRQAEGDPIIKMATDVRQGRDLVEGSYGESRVASRSALSQEDWLSADQILVWRNETRAKFNARIRQLRGHEGILPQPGERVVCLRNNHKQGLLNGSLWDVVSARDIDGTDWFAIVVREVGGIREVSCRAHKAAFLGQDPRKMEYFERLEAEEFEFGYALTVHKAQGSQWDHVLVYDECTSRDRKKWLYTAVTRAAKKLTVVVP